MGAKIAVEEYFRELFKYMNAPRKTNRTLWTYETFPREKLKGFVTENYERIENLKK